MKFNLRTEESGKLLATRLQLLYMMRPHCRVRSRMLEKLAENLKSLPDDFQVEILSRAVLACRGSRVCIEGEYLVGKHDRSLGRKKREELLHRALDYLEAWMIACKIPWSEESVIQIAEWHRKIESGAVKR